jgi:LuxR family maltose regulon positive regulatory protein
MPFLRLSWLGSPVIEYDGNLLQLEMRKTLALLAYLSLCPQSPSRETLASMFWPEFDQQHALTNLRRNLFSLTRSLPPGLLETDRERIGLRKDKSLQVDVEEFHHQLSTAREHSHPRGQACPDCLPSLEKAVTIYRGDFLEGFNLKDCPQFDEWQLFQREGLRSEYSGALQQLADYYQSQGEWEKAIQYARPWVALDHLNEAAQRMLIGLYNQSGQKSKAIRQYEVFVDLLRNELNQAPEAETQVLYQSMLPAGAPIASNSSSALSRFVPQQTEPLIKTKLFIPPLRVERITRPRLFEMLNAGSHRSLTLVSAPAGFGKTILLSSWAAHTSLPIAWFTVDEGDNDPVRFAAYLIAALDSVLSSDLIDKFQAYMQSFRPSIQSILIELVNHLAAESEPIVLILDDYQSIHSQDVHRALGFLLEKIPACLHLVIATRSDPPISLGRLRGRDQLVEIRMGDLRFSIDESARFLQHVMALHLSEEDVSNLENRTEGWIAGLQMAALAIRTMISQNDNDTGAKEKEARITQFIKAFSGSNRYILDYLGEEVLSRHPEEVRRFLLQTSILERFSGPLCDVVTQTSGSQDILEELEKENLFVVSLDNERRWYRYHQLFAELLRFNLEGQAAKNKESDQPRLPSTEDLHRRAAEWFEQRQLYGEAIHHFMAARDYRQAAAVIERQFYLMILASGQTYTLREWLALLPPALFQSRPRLNIAKAWILILENQFKEAKDRVDWSSQAISDRQGDATSEVQGEIALIRGAMAELYSRDAEEMRKQGLIAWEKLPMDDSMLRGLAAWLLGASHLFDGETHLAEDYLTQAIDLCKKAGNILITSVAILDLSNVCCEQGRYREAYQLLDQALQEMTSRRLQSHPSLGYLYYGTVRILLNWNELDEAERQLKVGINLVGQDIPSELLIMSTSIMPYIMYAQGRRNEAVQLAEECLQRVELYPFPYLPAMIKANLIRFWMRIDDQRHIEEWLASCGLTPDDTVRYIHDAEYTALAKVLIWQGRIEEALKVLAQLHDLAKKQGRNGKLFYILALQALAFKQSGDQDRALKDLEASLRLINSEGYIRPYADEGQPMEEMLQLGVDQGTWRRAHLESFVKKIMDAIRQDQIQPES